MKLFGYEFKRVQKRAYLSGPDSGYWRRIVDHYTGAYQQDVPIDLGGVLTYSTVFACVRQIATDIGKMPLRLMRYNDALQIFEPQDSPSFSPVLRKPNHYQTTIKFLEQWVICKLLHGNAYILKQRDSRGVVVKLYVLDPERVEVQISETGEVYYEISISQLPSIPSMVLVPATEIIHDVHIAPYHPLVGMGPIAAAGLPATHGLKIQQSQAKFFANMSRPSGMLTAPGTIKEETAKRLKESFEANFSGENIGRMLVAGDGLTFNQFTLTALDSQLIEQLKFTGEDVCRAFGVPAYKVGVGMMPTVGTLPALDQSYYSGCLQELIECIELLLDEGLNLPKGYQTQLDLDSLLRMDPAARSAVHAQDIQAGWKSPNEVRLRENYPPVVGGEEPIMQQQNWPLSVLAQRPPPDVTALPVAGPAEEPEDDAEEVEDDDDMLSAEEIERSAAQFLTMELEYDEFAA